MTTSSMQKRNWLLKRFDKAYEMGISIDKEKFISEFCFDLSSTRRVAVEFINHFVQIGKVLEVIEPSTNNKELIHPTVYKEYLEEQAETEKKTSQETSK